jgi:hypothetical protein
MTKERNIPFGKPDLAAIVLAYVPMMWQNQYNLTHLMIPELRPALLPDLGAIEQGMMLEVVEVRSRTISYSVADYFVGRLMRC